MEKQIREKERGSNIGFKLTLFSVHQQGLMSGKDQNENKRSIQLFINENKRA